MSGAGPSPAHELVERALAAAAAHPASAGTVVVVDEGSTTNLRWAANTLTTNGATRGQSVTVAAAVRGADGVSLATLARRGVGAGDVAALVADVQAAAAGAPPAEDAADLLAGTAAPGWDDGPEGTSPAVLADAAAGLGEAFGRARDEGRELFGYAEHVVATRWLGTSGGVRARHVQPGGTFELTAKAAARTRSTYTNQATRDFTDVDVAAHAAAAAERLRWQERTVEAAPGRYDTVLPPTAVADLMVDLLWSADARSAHEGRSAFSRRGGGTRVGEVLTDVPLTLRSDPAAPGLECEPLVLATTSGPFASAFDAGMPVPAQTWIDRGRLVALPSTRHTAALTGLGLHPAADNLLLSGDGATGTTEDLVARLDDGLLVTSQWYIREVDPEVLLLTGLTRDGVYRVRDGEVVGAVTNFRWNESPVDLLRRVDGVGTTVPALSREWGEWFPRTATPPLLVRDFHMSSTSAAS